MAGDPHPVFVDGVPVEKGNARSYLALRLGDADALRSKNLSTTWLVWVGTDLFYRDPSDTTSADNGTTVIHDGNSNRWKKASSVSGGVNVDAAGPVSEKSTYNTEAEGFTFLATDEGKLYVKQSATSGDWSTGMTLKGDIGNTGLTGPTGPGYGGTSTSSLTVGTGTQSFTTQAGLAYQVGTRVRIASSASPSNWMEGSVTSYSSTSMSVSVSKVGGSGTIASWTLSVAGEPGVSGAGTGDMLAANNLSDVNDANASRKNLGLVLDVKMFGAVGNGTTDDTQAFKDARDAAITAGTFYVRVPAGKYLIKSTISNNDGVLWVGDGAVYGDGSPTIARAHSSTQIIWDSGTTGSKMFSFRPALDNNTDVVMRGGGIKGILLDGSSVATCGIEVLSCQGLKFDGTHVVEMATSGTGWSFGTLASGTTAGKYTSSYHYSSNCSYSATTNSVGLALWGVGGIYNTCFSQWVGCNFKSGGTVSITLEDCDSNTFTGCSGNGWVFHAQGTGSYSSGTYLACRHNTFWGCIGTLTAKAKTSGTMHSLGNLWYGQNLDNSLPYPTIEAGADLSVLLTGLNFNGAYGAAQYGNAVVGTVARRATTQSLTNSTTTTITFTEPTFDVLNIFNSGVSSSRLTVPNGIKFVRITGQVTFDVNSTGVRYADVIKSGSVVVARKALPAVATFAVSASVDTGWFDVVPGDYYELRASQSSGGSLNALAIETWLQMEVK
jgi:hypothetical protein